MELVPILLFFITIFYFAIGALIDYWQSAMEHKLHLPNFIRDYFLIFWLILYNGLLPFLFVLVASNFNLFFAKVFISALLLGITLWDLIYSFLWKKTLISDQPIYFAIKNKNFALSKNKMLVWDIARVVVGLLLLVY